MAWKEDYPKLRERFVAYLLDAFPDIVPEYAVADDLCEIVYEVMPSEIKRQKIADSDQNSEAGWPTPSRQRSWLL